MGKSTSVLSAGLIALAAAGCTMPADRWNETPDWQPYQSPPGSPNQTTGGTVTPASPSDTAQPNTDLAQSVFFPPDTAELTPEARRELASWADRLRGDPMPVTVVGHGDEHSTRDYAIALGAKRAEAVKNYLVALGIPPERVATTTFGGERPAVPGATEEAQALDRRVVLRFESLAAVPEP